MPAAFHSEDEERPGGRERLQFSFSRKGMLVGTALRMRQAQNSPRKRFRFFRRRRMPSVVSWLGSKRRPFNCGKIRGIVPDTRHVRKRVSSWSEKEHWEKSTPADLALSERTTSRIKPLVRENQMLLLPGWGGGRSLPESSESVAGVVWGSLTTQKGHACTINSIPLTKA